MQIVYVPFEFPVPLFIYRIAVYVLLKYRCARYGYPFRKIKISNGQFVLVDNEDFDELNKYQWQFMKYKNTQYAFRIENGLKIVHMHREIMFSENYKLQYSNSKLKKSNDRLVVHHVNHNGLDNRRVNLRIVTYKQNAVNNRPSGKGTSKYKGVHWNRQKKKWVAGLRHNKKQIYLGSFKDEIEAAKVYDAAAKKYHGEYTWLNFPVSSGS